jgi:hypothetical protein
VTSPAATGAPVVVAATVATNSAVLPAAIDAGPDSVRRVGVTWTFWTVNVTGGDVEVPNAYVESTNVAVIVVVDANDRVEATARELVAEIG